jgi:hypothetical protein
MAAPFGRANGRLRNSAARNCNLTANQRLAFRSILLPNRRRLATEKTTIMLLGYARVSKAEDQETAPQIRALKKAGCKKVFEEAASGGKMGSARTASAAGSDARRRHPRRLETRSPVALT